METIKICTDRLTGSDSDICSDFNGYCTHLLGPERISESDSVSVNIPLLYPYNDRYM